MNIARRTVEYLCLILLGALVVVPFAQVVLRFFGMPIVGAEEFTRFLLICVVFVGFPLVVDAGENITMADLRDSLPERPRKVLYILIGLAAVFVAGFVAYVVLSTIGDNLNNATPTLKIPFWLFLGSTFFGFAAAAIIHVIRLLKLLRGSAS